MLASLAPHLQLASSPIDVIEFQGDDVARLSPRWAVGRSRIMFAAVGHIDRSRLSER